MAHRIVVGITQGDSNGIGYEVIIKALSDSRMMDLCVPILYGNSRTLGLYRKMIPETEQISTNVINTAADARGKRLNIINCVSDQLPVEPGQPTEAGAKAAVQSLEAAVKDLKEGYIDALVTAPFNKHTIAALGFGFPGHTEYLANSFGAKEGMMFMCTDNLKVGLVTNHEPLGKVAERIDKDLLVRKIRLMHESLKRDFAKDRPTIAVLGLNPHSGDGGSLGREEIDKIIPAIEQANAENILAFGPYSPDGFFSTNMQYNFDGVLAMYHDQGLIPFKVLAFDKGVNFTAGLPIVRTSPDHGTGYDIAGKNLANPTSMISAIYMAIDICRNRMEYDELSANPLEIKHFESSKKERTILPE
ncbi:MAG: 4-hydroxythreonine-4-phosphate dehydrogenase PdxA [Bacteroidales bacterium]|nr:4-hydroxythreonine-4-phosphate dehydrogenase PdxA [Bacteroidales bacterium]